MNPLDAFFNLINAINPLKDKKTVQGNLDYRGLPQNQPGTMLPTAEYMKAMQDKQERDFGREPNSPLISAHNLPPDPSTAPTMPEATAIPSPTANPKMDAMKRLAQDPSDPLREQIIAGINAWNTTGAPTPLMDNIDTYVEAAREFQKRGYDPMLPVILALRETQGGRDNLKPGTISGKNNPFNMRGLQNGQTKFVDYPDVKTAIFGGKNGDADAQGLVKLLTENPIYSDFQKSKSVKDLYRHWSPPTDGNGQLDEQEQNYNWFKDRFKSLANH